MSQLIKFSPGKKPEKKEITAEDVHFELDMQEQHRQNHPEQYIDDTPPDTIQCAQALYATYRLSRLPRNSALANVSRRLANISRLPNNSRLSRTP